MNKTFDQLYAESQAAHIALVWMLERSRKAVAAPELSLASVEVQEGEFLDIGTAA